MLGTVESVFMPFWTNEAGKRSTSGQLLVCEIVVNVHKDDESSLIPDVIFLQEQISIALGQNPARNTCLL
jgi:hypothetical protein